MLKKDFVYKILFVLSIICGLLFFGANALAFSVSGLGCRQVKTGTEFYGTISGLATGAKTNIYFELLLGSQKIPFKVSPDKNKTFGNGKFSFVVSKLFAGNVCKNLSSIKVYVQDGKTIMRAEEKGVFYEKCCYQSSQYKGRTAIIYNSQRQTTGYPFKVEGTGRDNVFESIDSAMTHLDNYIFPNKQRDIQQCNGIREDRMQGINASFVIDTSGSMDLPLGSNSKLEQVKNVFVNIARKQLIQNDRASVLGIAFANTIVPLTGNKEQVAQGILKLKALGDTRLFDAIVAGIRQVATNTPQKRAVIVFTDGNENDSRQYKNYKDVINIAKANNVKIFPIGMGQPGNHMALYRGRLIQVGLDTKTLNAIATGTGGKFYQIKDISEIFKIFEEVASQTRVSNQLPLCEIPKATLENPGIVIASGATANKCDGNYYVEFMRPDNVSQFYKYPISVSLTAGSDVAAIGGLAIESGKSKGNFKLIGRKIDGVIPANTLGNGQRFKISFNYLLKPGTMGKGDNIEILSAASQTILGYDNSKESLQGYANNLDINCPDGAGKVDLMVKATPKVVETPCGAKVEFEFSCVRSDGQAVRAEDVCPQFSALIGSSDAVDLVKYISCFSGDVSTNNCSVLQIDQSADNKNKNVVAANFPKGALKGNTKAKLLYEVVFKKEGENLEITQKGSTIDYIELPDGSAVKEAVAQQNDNTLYLGNTWKAQKCGQQTQPGGLKFERIVRPGDTCNTVKITLRATCEQLPCSDVFVQEYFSKDWRNLVYADGAWTISMKGIDSNVMGSLRGLKAGEKREMSYVIGLKGSVGQQVSTLHPDSYFAIGSNSAEKFNDEKFTIIDCGSEVKAKASVERSLELTPCGNSITARLKIKCEADPSQPNCGKVVIYEKLQSGASLGSIKQRKYGFLNPNLTNYKVEFTNGQMVITIPTMAAGTEEFYYYFDLDNLSATGDVITHQKSLFDYSDGIKNATGQITGEEKVVKSECKRPQLKASREISFPDKCGKLANLRLTLECVKGTGAPNECCGSATISDIIDQKVVVYYKDGVYKFSDILNSRAPDLSKNLTPSQFGATLPNNGLCQGDKAFLEYGVEFKNFGNDQQPHNTALSRIYYDNGQGKGDEEIQIDSPKVNVGGSGCLKNAKKVEVKLPCVAKVQGDHNIAFSFDLSGTMLNSNAVSYAKAGAMAFLQSLYQSSASSKYQIALNYFAHINKGDMVHPIISLTGDKKAARTALGEVNFLNFTNGGTSLLQGVNLAADQLALSNNSGTKNIILVTNGDVNVDSFGNKCDPNDIDKVRFQNCKKDIINAAQKIGAGLKIDGVRLYIVNYDDDKKTATQKQNDEEIYSYLTAFQDDRIINVSGTGGRNEFEVAFYKIDNLINAGAQCFDTNVIISLPKDRLKSVADIFGGYEGVNKEKGRPPVDRASTYEMKWEKLDPFSGFTIVSFVSEGDITKYNVADGFNFYVVIDGTKERMSTKQNILPDSVTITEAK